MKWAAQRGFSLLELAGAFALVAIMATVLLDRLTYYEELAEKARMEATVSTLKSALRIRMATMMIEGRVQEYRLLAGQNPIDWLDKTPDDYRGAVSDIAGLAAGAWYFNHADRTLVYLVRNGRYFRPDSEGLKRVRLKVVAISDRPGTQSVSETIKPADTVVIKLLEPYRWFQ